MNALGTHVLAEMKVCNSNILKDADVLKNIMVDAAHYANAMVVETMFQPNNRDGFDAIVVISESHLAMYTCPHENYVAVDAFTCGDKCNPMDAVEFIQKKLQAEIISYRHLPRGDFNWIRISSCNEEIPEVRNCI